MLAIAVAVELAVYDTFLSLPKLPLAILLATPLFLRRNEP
jgi:ABC-type dipeptide/oligopeptide/nickel transport system permease subunit